MDKRDRKKLTLARETLRRLSTKDLDVAVGGRIPWSEYMVLCWPSQVQSACHTHCVDKCRNR